jgi:acyl carrier protein
MKTIEQRVIECIDDQLCGTVDVTTVTRAVELESLGADSLDVLEIVMMLEDEFGIEIADQDVPRLRTVDDLVRYVERLTG